MYNKPIKGNMTVYNKPTLKVITYYRVSLKQNNYGTKSFIRTANLFNYRYQRLELYLLARGDL